MISAFSARPDSIGHSSAITGTCRLRQGAYAVGLMARTYQFLFGLLFLAALICGAGSAYAQTAPIPNDPAVARKINPTTDCREYPGAIPEVAVWDERGRAQAIARSSTLNSLLQQTDPDAYYAGTCIADFAKMVDKVFSAISAIGDGFNPPFVAMVSIAVTQIFEAIMTQIMNNLESAICNATQQITDFISSAARNLICIPQIKAINPFDFNIDLEPLTCDGWSFDVLRGEVVGSPIEGLDVDLSNLYDRARQQEADEAAAKAAAYDQQNLNNALNNAVNNVTSSGYVPPPTNLDGGINFNYDAVTGNNQAGGGN
jgi:hypothetical protein